MSERDHWRIRDGNEKDLQEILSLRKEVFGGTEEDKLDPRFWRWEFTECPEGKAYIYIVEDGDKIVGHFADLPRRFSAHGKIVRGTLSVDLMVAPDYRRKGLFGKMGKYGIDKVKREQGLFLTAYPIREETINGFKKIGWKEVVKLPVLVYPLKFTGIVNRYLHTAPLSLLIGGMTRFFYSLLYSTRKKRAFANVEIEEVAQLDDAFDRFLDKTFSLYPIMGIRDRDYMTWRYLRHPTRTYTIYRAMEKGEMKGFIILRKVDLLEFHSVVIVDLLALDEEVLMALVEKGIVHSQKEGVDLLGFMVPKLHPYYQLLKRNGFLPSPKTFLFMIYSHEEDEELLDPKEWYVNWGDTDVI